MNILKRNLKTVPVTTRHHEYPNAHLFGEFPVLLDLRYTSTPSLLQILYMAQLIYGKVHQPTTRSYYYDLRS